MLWQQLSDCHLVIGGGDVNARTKDLLDFIPEVDGENLPQRFNTDKVKDSHAVSFITFLKDNRSVILNGRITPPLDCTSLGVELAFSSDLKFQDGYWDTFRV